MKITRRDSLEFIKSVQVDGVEHSLGEHRDFHKDAGLHEFIPALARLSMSWVRLDVDEELSVHEHPTKSMIIVAEGTGRTQGEITTEINAGDIITIPPNTKHGFVGAGSSGFHALSIQFEGTGLYENEAAPRVRFEGDSTAIDTIRAENNRYMAEYEKHPLVELVRKKSAQSPETLAQLLDYLQTWSDAFQRVVTARVVAETDSAARLVAEEHLEEERGHNALLGETRSNRPAQWDPVIAAVSSWFVDRMTHLNTIERTVLAHLVLEGSGLVFHSAGQEVFSDSEYFSLHDAADVEHLEMGYRALEERDDWKVDQVSATLREGWQMMNLLSDRLAELAVSAD